MTPFWIALCLDKNTVAIAACGLKRENTIRRARKQMPHAPLLCVDFTVSNGQRISAWLAENDIIGADNINIVRSIGTEIGKMITDIAKEKRGHNEPRLPNQSI